MKLIFDFLKCTNIPCQKSTASAFFPLCSSEQLQQIVKPSNGRPIRVGEIAFYSQLDLILTLNIPPNELQEERKIHLSHVTLANDLDIQVFLNLMSPPLQLEGGPKSTTVQVFKKTGLHNCYKMAKIISLFKISKIDITVQVYEDSYFRLNKKSTSGHPSSVCFIPVLYAWRVWVIFPVVPMGQWHTYQSDTYPELSMTPAKAIN